MTAQRRCAIYTRKSTDEGLEQDFNSLHAQREACEAFIRSQRHEGWVCLDQAYDDGGISGATMQRPALQRLLSEVQAGRIDVVVVYKVDRLTRSLADFAKIVEIFDARGASFVSVTQQFNTTSSMGRLTLNVLLSFAQFEREVTGERIRDKIAASKKKGMWMGGLVPLGYDLKDRGLVINPAEARTVQTLFQLYQEIGTVRQLKEAADRLGLMTKLRGQDQTGRMFSRGHLYSLLANPLYTGEVIHKGVRYPGRQEAIIDRKTFEAVQRQLAGNTAARKSRTNTKAPSLLAGLIYDQTGDRLCPTHANKKGRRYRYYISSRLMHSGGAAADGWRLPANELDATISNAVCQLLNDPKRILEALQLDDASPEGLRAVIGRAAAVAAELKDRPFEHRRQLLSALIVRIVLHAESIQLQMNVSALASLIVGSAEHSNKQFCLILPVQLRRHGVEAKLVMATEPGQGRRPDAKLVALLAEAHRWVDDLTQGAASSVRGIAARYDRDPGEVSRTLPLAFLAPDIIEAILEGRQPVELTPRHLKRIGFLPIRWQDQRRRLGFGA
jgi:site-specific DNA recombinase